MGTGQVPELRATFEKSGRLETGLTRTTLQYTANITKKGLTHPCLAASFVLLVESLLIYV